jgi:predicted transcriptional regulator
VTVKTIIFSVRSQKETIADMKTGWKSGVRQETAQFSFATSELMSKVLTEKRWEILKALCGAGPVTFRKAAELVGRDVKGVHADLTALIKAGVVDRESDGVIFPYDTIEVDYELTRSLPTWLSQAAAAKLRSDALGAYLDDWEAKHGEFTPEELARAKEDLTRASPASIPKCPQGLPRRDRGIRPIDNSARSHDVLDELKRKIAAEVASRFTPSLIRAHSLGNLHRWKRDGVWGPVYEERQTLLEVTNDGELFAIMLGRDEHSNRLRQSAPYVGLLPREVVRRLNEEAAG